MKNVNHNKSVSANGVRESHLAKKNDLRIQKNPFLRFSVSLLLSLFLVYTVFQIQTPNTTVKDVAAVPIEDPDAFVMENFTVEQVVVEKIQEPEPVVEPTIITDILKVVDNDTKDLNKILSTSTEPVEVTTPFDPNSVVVDDGPTEIEEVPFVMIEDAPIYPGCEKFTSKEDRKACMSRMIQKHVNRKFDAGLANDLGLAEGKKRITVLFMIDEKGNVTGIQSHAPHPKLKKEAERVVRLLPKMEPGKQQNKAVKVKYTLPIIFRVD